MRLINKRQVTKMEAKCATPVNNCSCAKLAATRQRSEPPRVDVAELVCFAKSFGPKTKHILFFKLLDSALFEINVITVNCS